ncbi:MAG: DUF547 domain-containing protein [Pseudomonadota bacterium]
MTVTLTRRAFLAASLLVLPAFGSVQRFLAPDAEPWPFWEAHDPTSRRTIDHGAWAAFLDTNLRRSTDGVHLVAYGDVSPQDIAELDRYLRDLVDTPVLQLNRNEQLAYWINLYNALTVRLVLREYPVRSIRDINLGGGGVAGGPWAAKLVTVEGNRISLNDIEHRIIRPIWRDPRIHYAVNCAAIGCPNLAASPWRGDGVNAALEAAGRAYVNNPRGVSFRRNGPHVSRIYDWFVEDFGGNEQAVLDHLLRFAEPDLTTRLREEGRISGQFYDWRLNDAAKL